jgi:hypothetical protein
MLTAGIGKLLFFIEHNTVTGVLKDRPENMKCQTSSFVVPF